MPHLAALGMLTALSWLCLSEQVRSLAGSCCPITQPIRAFAVTCAGTLANHVTIRGGGVIRALYFRQECGLSFAEFGAVLIGQALLGTTLAAAAMIGSVLCVSDSNTQGWELMAMVVCAIVPPVFLVSVGPIISQFIANWRIQFAVKLVTALALIGRSPRSLIQACFWWLGSTSCASARLWLIYTALDVNISVLGCLFVTSACALSTLLSITPGGLGLREGTNAVAGLIFGVPPNISLVVATTERAVLVVVAVLLGGPSLIWIARHSTIQRDGD